MEATQPDLFSIALALFIILNPIGNLPAILALIKGFDFAHQRWIMIREGLFALSLALIFQFVGEGLLNFLGIAGYTLRIAGGFLLLVVGLSLIFPKAEEEGAVTSLDREPYFVPIATPLLAGPGTLTTIMIFSKITVVTVMVGALLVAFAGVLIVLISGPYLLRIFGRRGLVILEQVMGIVLMMLGTELIVAGMGIYLTMLKSG